MEIVKELKSVANPEAIQGMARFGINPENTLGVSIPVLRDLAKRTGRDHSLAQELWDSSIHEARILAALIDDPAEVTEQQMESWVKELDSWDICDQVCSNLFDRTAFAFQKAAEWSKREEEFVKRAGFVLMAALSVHDKKAENEQFSSFFPLLKAAATDDRNYVKKAVNWALRQMGKRNPALNRKAIEMAEEIQKMNSKAARWIASDAIRELKSEAVQKKLKGLSHE